MGSHQLLHWRTIPVIGEIEEVRSALGHSFRLSVQVAVSEGPNANAGTGGGCSADLLQSLCRSECESGSGRLLTWVSLGGHVGQWKRNRLGNFPATEPLQTINILTGSTYPNRCDSTPYRCQH
ncbi:hypothetical protein TRVL_01418 [Trypanosoma vivax]|uniref:Uncharacterized protein n=1 Tax=Trypanosoma vivax (strain Y486) TaxID=1055687 RepID=G0TUX4_TRYVY|nr:hypothetical protein TRVL_01418 [Trypanosoma vivax]CCC47761.1 hypothetical protein TVY486_0404290 [Trypanosoma vivax Y486]